MSNEREKERWLKIQENKQKCCINCSQLMPYYTGEYICYYLKSKDDRPRGGVIIHANDINKIHARCFDKYNGLNLK